MKVQFHQPRKLGKVSYAKGTHEVPDSFKSDWFFKAQLEEGACALIPDMAKAEAPKKETPAKPQPQK